jgi:hypothetical protein
LCLDEAKALRGCLMGWPWSSAALPGPQFVVWCLFFSSARPAGAKKGLSARLYSYAIFHRIAGARLSWARLHFRGHNLLFGVFFCSSARPAGAKKGLSARLYSYAIFHRIAGARLRWARGKWWGAILYYWPGWQVQIKHKAEPTDNVSNTEG